MGLSKRGSPGAFKLTSAGLTVAEGGDCQQHEIPTQGVITVAENSVERAFDDVRHLF